MHGWLTFGSKRTCADSSNDWVEETASEVRGNWDLNPTAGQVPIGQADGSYVPGAQSGGSGLDQLTGDVTAGPGSGSQVATLATVNPDVGSFTNANVTVNGKGLITAVANGTDHGITQLTGDVTAGPGDGSQAATLATVNANVGSFTNANVTVNGKGLITAVANGTDHGITQLTGDVTAGPGDGSQAATLATVNANVGSFTNANVTVNGKGLITAVANGTDHGITQLTGDVTAGPGDGSQAATLATVNANVGSFTNAGITVNAKGLITAAANGASMPILDGSVDLTGQSANIGNTVLYAVPSGKGGMYRVSGYVVITQAASTSSSIAIMQCNWSDEDTTVSEGASVTGTSASNTVGTNARGIIVIRVLASTFITVNSTSYASVGTTPMLYAFHAKVEYLGA